MKLTNGLALQRRIRRLDPDSDAYEIARLSLVTLNGSTRLTYALFTVAFMKQVAVPEMARILYRRGRGDIVRDTILRNDDTLVFFGQLLDHGPDSDVGSVWITRLNEIHAHFPIRNADSLYTLATLALDPHDITSALARSPFSPGELDAHWRFWRRVAERQHIDDIPQSREELVRWAADYEVSQYESSVAGREITSALIDAFNDRVLPRCIRPLGADIISAISTPRLRAVHGLPTPRPVVRWAVTALVWLYVTSTPLRLVPTTRSFAADFGDTRHGSRTPDQVGYRAG